MGKAWQAGPRMGISQDRCHDLGPDGFPTWLPGGARPPRRGPVERVKVFGETSMRAMLSMILERTQAPS